MLSHHLHLFLIFSTLYTAAPPSALFVRPRYYFGFRQSHSFFSSRIGFSLSLYHYYYVLLCYFVLFILTVFLFSRPRLSVFQHAAFLRAHTITKSTCSFAVTKGMARHSICFYKKTTKTPILTIFILIYLLKYFFN